ncbi:glycosyl transferase group 1 [Gloeocapsa sp. PCC 7428]|uniref:glycosyltransferase family 4 protein n=1 Tax=Gloeocapsa sp. PCC 7428 TaxID=1173026 RepID=UPI0002A5E627|nr:glycosyltransferase family 4 protein [Gloeocapsa sp. PCC 7428]AFZ32837.1 glycosyl transferase group 1 [Gloeocapsa sp. PCC 7428]
MRLTLVIHALTAGGAERVMSIMANYWAAKGWDITLVTMDDGSIAPFYELDSRIKHIPLGLAVKSPNFVWATWHNLRRVFILRNTFYQLQPDAVISFLDTTNILTLLATRSLKIPVIVDEQNHPAMYSIGKSWEKLRTLTYPQASRVVAVTARALSYFSPAIQSRGYVIPNPALSVSHENLATLKLEKPFFIAIGRLEEQKGFDILLHAFEQVANSYPQWKLIILGEGSLRPQLEALICQLNLVGRVQLQGIVKNPFSFLQQAEFFVMSSRYEGFPNALCEAMACGLPAISTDCPSGPREIIRDNVDGILVPSEDVSALATAIERLIADEKERQRLATRAVEVTERFSLEKVMNMWEALLVEVISQK